MYRGEISDTNRPIVGYNECVTRFIIGTYDNSKMPDIFHPLLALIASATDKELARYVEFLKEENKILRTRIKGQVHTKPEERKRLLKLGKPLGKAIEELITIVKPSTFYRWCRDGVANKKIEESQGRSTETERASRARAADSKIHKFWIDSHRRRIAQIGNQEDQSIDGVQHSEGGRHRARTRSHFRLVDELS